MSILPIDIRVRILYNESKLKETAGWKSGNSSIPAQVNVPPTQQTRLHR